VLRKLGRFQEAAEDYGRVVGGGQGSARLYNNYAFCLAKLGMYAEAVAAYASALQLDPASVHAFYNR
jgi:tetratricopeptide (TPR) repeat protein